MTSTIVWTKIDEAPALATYSFLPIVQAFTKGTGVEVVTSDISLAGRILAAFPERLGADQRIGDNLAELGALTLTPEANIIKLPNISASVPQLKAAIAELRSQGFDVPDYPEAPATDEEKATAAAYSKVLGSAVNPVLREGNSDRRAPLSVKNFAKKHPHRLGAWDPATKAHVATMTEGDFYGNEQSVVMADGGDLRIEHVAADGTVTVLAAKVPTLPGEIVDGTFMSVAKLRDFYAAQIEAAKAAGLLLSLHLKATMMKVSDPVMFGHAVSVFYAPVLEKYADVLAGLGVNPNLGMGDLAARIAALPRTRARPSRPTSPTCMPCGRPSRWSTATRASPTCTSATTRSSTRRCRLSCATPARCGTGTASSRPPSRWSRPLLRADVCRGVRQLPHPRRARPGDDGLGAQRRADGPEGRGVRLAPDDLHPPAAGTVRVVGPGGVLMSHGCGAGDIWRMSRVRDIPIQDWVKLAVTRARITGAPACFYLDEHRAHDANVIAKVQRYLADHDLTGIEYRILAPVEAIRWCLERIREGKDTISVTGNVLRDYLTDLFPILELGTSAKMLSVVPLLAGGGLFETGAGGSAPKHVQQFVAENYLRWDSLGEFSALGASLEHVAQTTGNAKAQVLADALDTAIATFLDENKSPARKVGQIDNRGSHFYLALYWAEAVGRSDRRRRAGRSLRPGRRSAAGW
jgi:isocitrate dehydrogenase